MHHETAIRLGFFSGIFILVALGEILMPRRPLTTSKAGRWFTNLVIIALNPLVVRIMFPILPVALAVLASQRQWGLLNILALPYWLEVAIGVIVLDFVIYIQHVLFHAIPTLWRLHMMHHADLDFDVTTGLRFHPIEIAASMAIKLTAVMALGPPALAVLIFEVALNATSMFNHSNMRLPLFVDRLLRLLVVTPDMHRVHHSVIIRETNSNYGFNLPWWDRLFGTYTDQPQRGHADMTIGLSQFRDPKGLTLLRLIVLPFVGDPGRVPINRH
ncbi:sterol desaturase family protein [Desulfoferrobacter suflitae]|uniref:sterol desaturase family protein n=1 Tax=Desulfoferrobacter suflitae TaxID=2865782 RepID=UPI002164D803|nr:sterol desaturase family protein [Desulfoferrobacter suflitae]MCK8601794.1 sterol desaturase family protein [Desulfoferrobacter suflitae]